MRSLTLMAGVSVLLAGCQTDSQSTNAFGQLAQAAAQGAIYGTSPRNVAAAAVPLGVATVTGQPSAQPPGQPTAATAPQPTVAAPQPAAGAAAATVAPATANTVRAKVPASRDYGRLPKGSTATCTDPQVLAMIGNAWGGITLDAASVTSEPVPSDKVAAVCSTIYRGPGGLTAVNWSINKAGAIYRPSLSEGD